MRRTIWRVCSLGLLALVLGPGCGSLGREINQALPEFLRSDPGADEIARYQQRVRILNRTEEEKELAKEAFVEAKATFDRGEWEPASVELEDYLENFPDTEDDREARFMLINAYLEDDEEFKATEAIRSFLANYPISRYNDELEQLTFDLAVEYLDGEHDVFIFSKVGDGVKLMRDLVLHFPNGAHADEAQWRLGQHYWDEGEYLDAATAFGAIVEQYPRSPWAPRALFNRGMSRLARVKGPEYDVNTMKDALADFRAYLEKHSEGDRRDEAAAHVKQLEDLLGEKQLVIGEWYLDQGYPGAARFYFNRVLSRHGETPSAAAARQYLAELPADDDAIDFEHTPAPPPAPEAPSPGTPAEAPPEGQPAPPAAPSEKEG